MRKRQVKSEQSLIQPKIQHRFSLEGGTEWDYIGEGGLNYVYKSIRGDLVLKIQKDKKNKTDAPDRSVRLMHEINPSFSSEVKEHTFTLNNYDYVAWSMPFFEGSDEEPNDEEIAAAVFKIYQTTKRIVVDALAPGNFIKVNEEVICVDVGMAKRRGSVVSDKYWKRTGDANKKQWSDYPYDPITTCTLQALECLDSLDFIRDSVLEKTLFDQFFYLQQKGVLLQRVNEKTTQTEFNQVHDFSKEASALEDLLNSQGSSSVANDMLIKAQCVFDEVITLAKNPKIKLPELTTVLKETRELLPSNTAGPYGNSTLKVSRLDAYRAKAKRISGKRSWGKRLAGAMLALLGAVVVCISVAAIIKSCGLLAVFGGIGAKFGKSMVVKGVAIGVGKGVLLTGSFAIWKSKRRGVSKAMMNLADAADPKKTRVKKASSVKPEDSPPVPAAV